MTAGERLRVAVLVSGSGTNLQAIIDARNAGDLAIDIAAVISDRPEARGLARATAAGIPARGLDRRAFASRTVYDAALQSCLEDVAPDLVILAGYMRIIATQTVEHFAGRMLNIHPSLLPAYPGLNTYARVLAAGDSWHGSTVHYVIPELDSGPPVIQFRVPVRANESEQSLQKRVQQGEYVIYPRAIGWIADGRLKWREGRVFLDGEPLDTPRIIDEQDEFA